ncbi:MAG: carbonic anhydrase [Limisphaerales bacterium]
MRLFETIIDANHRALGGDASAGLHPADFAQELPMVALTCIDVRLNRLLPEVLGVAADQFIWLRNAGNIITGPLSSTMRSLALACALKGGRSVAVIGHTDCQAGKFTTMQLIERFQALGVARERLPENINEFFGTFASERANVIKAVDFVRRSPIISPRIAVHGLLVDTETGRLDCVVNGYQDLDTLAAQMPDRAPQPGPIKPVGAFDVGALKFPEVTIGQTLSSIGNWPGHTSEPAQTSQPPKAPEPRPQPPPRIPMPPPIDPRLRSHKEPRSVRPKA